MPRIIRRPLVAGRFYEAGFGELDSQITDCFEGKRGPGVTPGKRKEKIVRGLIAPHAGYMFSGACAAWGYKELGESRFPDAYVLLGPSHHGYGSCISAADWETPFGIARNHDVLTERIARNTGIPISERPHREEHSIEVQIPFLQFISKDRLSQLRIIPMIISGDVDRSEVGKKIIEAAEGKDIVIIASSDLSHIGPNYGYQPFTQDLDTQMPLLDKKAIDAIIEKDPVSLMRHIKETGATICGVSPMITLLGALKNSTAKKLMYYTSGDLTRDYTNAVGYASILFT